MKRIWMLTLAVCLAWLLVCEQVQGEQPETPSSESSLPASPQQTHGALPNYLAYLADWEKAFAMECVLTRDDLGIQIIPSPSLVSNLAGCLLSMELTPDSGAMTTLNVPYPFTLSFRVDGKEEWITVSDEKVTLSGVVYTASNPDALAELFEDDYEHFLTGDIYLLKEELPFTAEAVDEVQLNEHENYSDGATQVTTTDKEAIGRIVQALSDTVIRSLEPDEEPGMFVGVGGNGYFCTLVAGDGAEWSINPRGLATITTADDEKDVLVLSMDFDAVFGLLMSTTGVPSLQPHIGDVKPTVYERAYEIENQRKSMSHVAPVGMLFDSDPVLPPQETYACQLEWRDTTGDSVTPLAISATLYRERGEQGEWTDAGTSLQEEDSVLTLPGGEGKRFVTVRAQLSDDSWVEHIFAYRASIYPTAFYDISYGNDEGALTLTRGDMGVSVTGTQNRKYIDFVLGLELMPTAGEEQSLPVRKPITMTFSADGVTHELVLTEKGAAFNGQTYLVGNTQAIEDLYAPFDIEDLNMFERINYDLRGFLTKDVAYFLHEFPLNTEDIEVFTIIREEPEQRVHHDSSYMDPQQIREILGYVVLGKGWQKEDYYTLRRFYLSYELALKDGTTYVIGERILKNGADTGWYTIQSDSPLAMSGIEQMEGSAEQREIPVHGGIGMDDKGNIIID